MKAKKVISTKIIPATIIQWAAEQGVEVEVMEVLGIQNVPFSFPETPPKHLLFSSQNAVLVVVDSLHSDFIFHCVGEKTKRTLEQLGYHATTCEANMELLLSALPNRQISPINDFLYIRGREVSQDIRPFFQSLQEIVVYESTLLYPPTVNLQGVAGVLFFSPRGAASFLKNNFPLPKNCLIGAIGRTTAESLKANWGMESQIVASEPSAERLLQEMMLFL